VYPTVRVIVAGSRNISHQPTVDYAIIAAFNEWISKDQARWMRYVGAEIVSGGAYGVDFCGEKYAKKCKMPLTIFKAEWDKYGKRAGVIRNEQMAEYADALIAVWDGESRGTAHMIKTMEALGKPVFVYKTSISKSEGTDVSAEGTGYDPVHLPASRTGRR
jgi:predicted Rossmann fold nucleotide-binding protein DprA/Smf involved in DNA uptake